MTKHEIEAISYLILAEQSDKTGSAREALRDLALRLAVQFNIWNPSFDKEQFMEDCGLKVLTHN